MEKGYQMKRYTDGKMHSELVCLSTPRKEMARPR
jgi:hypothetical protein